MDMIIILAAVTAIVSLGLLVADIKFNGDEGVDIDESQKENQGSNQENTCL